ncbi:hypothetical protein [Nocardia terpenica]|uniref:Uncharacterized protein n=1 Tax=Nocardia terpenica TaxID=455432 RepID=A0A6G9ZDX3_9NOCA|nr:hypothetical protein [Nocardia terpenica]QIS23815.1 hypothetical protein F6W96_41545 [Nocardia terpenica]
MRQLLMTCGVELNRGMVKRCQIDLETFTGTATTQLLRSGTVELRPLVTHSLTAPHGRNRTRIEHWNLDFES